MESNFTKEQMADVCAATSGYMTDEEHSFDSVRYGFIQGYEYAQRENMDNELRKKSTENYDNRG